MNLTKLKNKTVMKPRLLLVGNYFKLSEWIQKTFNIGIVKNMVIIKNKLLSMNPKINNLCKNIYFKKKKCTYLHFSDEGCYLSFF